MKNTIKLNKEFRYAYRQGKKTITPVLIMHSYRNRDKELKYGITVSTSIGGAVVRNKVKRMLREAFRAEKSNITKGYHVVLVARSQTVGATLDELRRAIRYCINKNNIGIKEK